jgi:Na+-transporting methylmalonyl-CoA/oxaloacetate decarboxylase gamma subunit
VKLSIILFLLKLAVSVVGWLERERWKAEGRREVNEQARAAHDARVAEANAARDDFDHVSSVHDDPRNRDNR